jgi:hypothetical protein
MNINEQILSHEMTVNWRYQTLANTLDAWIDGFNRHFFENELPTLFLCFETERTSLAVQYRPGRNSVGAVHQVNLNPRQLDRPTLLLCRS